MELQKRPENDLAEILRTKSDRVLSLKCLHNAEFSDLQNNILNILSRDSRPLNIETVSSESFTNILKTRNELTEKFLPLVISQISSAVNGSESEKSIERASDLLCAIIVNCDKSISESILNGVERSIENEFYRGQLLNSLIVKICK